MDPSTIQSVTLLGTPEQIRWESKPEGLAIRPPIQRPLDHAYVYKIVFRGALPQPARDSSRPAA